MPKSKKSNQQKPKMVKMMPMRGGGDYSSMLNTLKNDALSVLKPAIKTALVGAGRTAGGFIGDKIGAGKQGADIGGNLATRLSKIFGMGDYSTNACACNALIKGSPTSAAYAQFGNMNDGTRVVHRDYISDVYTSTVTNQFTNTVIPINPGLASFVPYLSNIAQNYEEYRINGMVFEFISTTSPFSTGNSMGSVIMSMEYNAANPAYTSKAQMENSDFAISARFDKNMAYGVECKTNAQNHYYVRSGASALPVTTTDLGLFQIATNPSSTFPTNSAIGELWVSYDITFYRPRVSPARFGYAHLTWGPYASGTSINFAGIITAPQVVSNIQGNLTGLTTKSSGNGFVISFPFADVGDQYLVSVAVTSSTALGPTNSVNVFAGTNMTQIAVYSNSSGSYQASAQEGIGPPNNLTGSSVTGFTFTAIYQVNIEDEPGLVPTINTPGTFWSAATAGNVFLDIVVASIGNGIVL
jgi:hypothetical protein